MAAPFLRAKGYGVGQSNYDEHQVNIATALLEGSKTSKMEIILPVDVVIADGFANNAATRIVPTRDIDNDWILMDIGPKTVALFDAHLQIAKTVMWNGPMGVAEFSNFARGTSEIANRLSLRSQGISIAGGGSTSQMIHDLGLSSSYTHVSTGGGASLEFLEGKDLPAIKALLDKD